VSNIFVVVEGYTELEFVNSLLGPHLIDNGANLVKAFPITTNSDLGKKGGGQSYKHLRKDLLKSVAYNPHKIVTTFIDYYALPKDFPSFQECHRLNTVDERIACLENAMKRDIAPDNPYFLPYIQKHEFEALLFSSNIGFETYFAENSELTRRILQEFHNPEEINDGHDTAPSKRLINLVPEYNKVLFGNLLAIEIGLQTILAKCPRFRNWVEALANAVGE